MYNVYLRFPKRTVQRAPLAGLTDHDHGSDGRAGRTYDTGAPDVNSNKYVYPRTRRLCDILGMLFVISR